FGGFEGRALKQGDVLRAMSAGTVPLDVGRGLVPPALTLPLLANGTQAVRVLPAAEASYFTDESVRSFYADEWKITAQSDRYGFRLAGEALVPNRPMELASHGIVPGVIQVPHNGQPIIQMRDAQPSGGYPKIGSVIEADLWRLGQAPVGSRIRFIETTWSEAVAALDETQAWLDECQRLLDLQRWAKARA
ncbi:MAG: urea amidolyase related protein, partial [Rhizobacter sp.]|nr:urea amidolyase related protein [Rhizobacter sp.]